MSLKKDKVLQFIDKVEQKTATVITTTKQKTDQIRGISPAPEIIANDDANSSFVIINEQKLKKQTLPIKIFSWKMFGYGWMGFAFVGARAFVLSIVLLAFSGLYLYKLIESTKQTLQSIKQIDFASEEVVTRQQFKSQIKTQSTALYDGIAFGLSLFFGFFGNQIILYYRLKNGWKIAPLDQKTAEFVKKRYFLKNYPITIIKN